MKNQIITQTFRLAIVFALLTLMPRPSASLASASSAQLLDPAPTNENGTDWDAPAPAPEDPLDSSMPPLTTGKPARFPVIEAQEGEKPVVAAHTSAPGAPMIDLWYGADQTFGQIGNPQAQINVLGNVTGTLPISLTYALNGGEAQVLSTGPDDQRLADDGDFNIEITRTNLISGLNQIVISATDSVSATTVVTANITYVTADTWPLNYMIDWSTVSAIQDVAQVVDGHWALDNIGVRPLQINYDRLLAIGDNTWKDYEVTVPVFIRGIDPSGFDAPSNGAGVGLIAGWQGHTLLPQDTQPATGWRTQLGALAWYRWGRNDTNGMELRGYGGGAIATNSSRQLDYNTQYMMKLSVQSRSSSTAYYRFKVWPAGEPEPAVWDMQGAGRAGEPASGSVLLVAHHVDVSFGDVTVTPLSEIKPTLTVGTVGQGTVTTTPKLAQYSYGQTIQATATSGAGRYFDRWSGDFPSVSNPLFFDITQNTVITANFTLTQTTPISSAIVSDDFNNCSLGSEWEFLNPLNDGTMRMDGSQIYITVPEGTSHNVYSDGIPAPRVMQSIANTDFEVIVKFESSVNRRYQVQGIIVEQDLEPNAEDFIRFDFFHDGTDVHIYAASIVNGIPSVQIDDLISPTGIYSYLKIRREGNVWIESYSFDGVNYSGRSFVLAAPFNAAKIGVFAANHGNSALPATIPAHTAIVDYFFNAAAPIAPEDAKPSTLTVAATPEKGGSVTVTDPQDKITYACGETITVKAEPAAGYTFEDWSGEFAGQPNPLVFDYDLNAPITATFVKNGGSLYLPLVSSGK